MLLRSYSALGMAYRAGRSRSRAAELSMRTGKGRAASTQNSRPMSSMIGHLKSDPDAAASKRKSENHPSGHSQRSSRYSGTTTFASSFSESTASRFRFVLVVNARISSSVQLSRPLRTVMLLFRASQPMRSLRKSFNPSFEFPSELLQHPPEIVMRNREDCVVNRYPVQPDRRAMDIKYFRFRPQMQCDVLVEAFFAMRMTVSS